MAYSKELRERAIARMLPPINASTSAVSRELNIPQLVCSRKSVALVSRDAIAGSGQCDRLCSKMSILAGLPMMP
jgi:hypothetical protein